MERMIFTIASAIAFGAEIRFPALGTFGHINDKMARCKLGHNGCPWNPFFQNLFEAWQNGQEVDLTEGGLIRMGCSACLATPQGVVLGQFDSTHPTMARKWTSPAELWGDGTPRESALSGLGQEVIVTREGKVGFWCHEYSLLEEEWVRRFAADHDMEVDDKLVVDIWTASMYNTTQLLFGDQNCGNAFVAAEFATGGLEAIFPFELVDTHALDGITLLDGEWLDFNSTWRHSKVGFMNADTIGKMDLTTKAIAIASAYGFRQ